MVTESKMVLFLAGFSLENKMGPLKVFLNLEQTIWEGI